MISYEAELQYLDAAVVNNRPPLVSASPHLPIHTLAFPASFVAATATTHGRASRFKYVGMYSSLSSGLPIFFRSSMQRWQGRSARAHSDDRHEQFRAKKKLNAVISPDCRVRVLFRVGAIFKDKQKIGCVSRISALTVLPM